MAGLCRLLEEARDELVGEQHQLLDHGVGALHAGILRAAHHVDRRAGLRVEHDARLGQVEVERAAVHAPAAQLARELVEHVAAPS